MSSIVHGFLLWKIKEEGHHIAIQVKESFLLHLTNVHPLLQDYGHVLSVNSMLKFLRRFKQRCDCGKTRHAVQASSSPCPHSLLCHLLYVVLILRSNILGKHFHGENLQWQLRVYGKLAQNTFIPVTCGCMLLACYAFAIRE